MAPAPMTGLRAVPWKLVLELATLVVNRFREDLRADDRRRLTDLVRKSKGDPRRLTQSERDQMLDLVRRVDVKRLGRDATALVGARRLRKRFAR